MAKTASSPASIVRYRCEQYPALKVRVASDRDADFEQIHYVEFRAGVLDLSTDDPFYAQSVAALEKARLGGTPIALVGDVEDDVDLLSLLTCKEFRCGHISRNEAAAKAHSNMHIRQAAAAADTGMGEND